MTILTEEERLLIIGRRVLKAMAWAYPQNSVLVANLCDHHLDHSGRLLGEVREEARSVSEPDEPATKPAKDSG